MRMHTGVNPSLICMQHLNGEHNELHKHRPDFVKRRSIAGRIEKDQIEPGSMKSRHDLLAEELDRRAKERGSGGHKSPYSMPDISYLPKEHREHKQDRKRALRWLKENCRECRKRIMEA